jgi:hypothetical protein
MERQMNLAEEAVEKSRGTLGNNITVAPPSPSEMASWELAKSDVNSIIAWTEIIKATRQRHPHLSFKRTSLLTATVWNRLQKNLQTKSKTHPFAKESLLDWVNRFSWSDVKLMQILSVAHACVDKRDFIDKFKAEVPFPHVPTGFVLNPWNVHTIYDKETTYSMRAKNGLSSSWSTRVRTCVSACLISPISTPGSRRSSLSSFLAALDKEFIFESSQLS